MHGIVYQQLMEFVKQGHGEDALNNILKDAGLEGKFYSATKSHPDEDIEAIVASACKALGTDRDTVLEAFGVYIAPDLLKIFSSYVKNDWKAMDLLEHIETTIHKSVRITNPEADPPALKIERVSDNEVLIHYSSQRKMIALGVGIIKAIGDHYNESMSIDRQETATGTTLRVLAA